MSDLWVDLIYFAYKKNYLFYVLMISLEIWKTKTVGRKLHLILTFLLFM